MDIRQNFIQEGFSVIDTENKENMLMVFLKQNYPSVIQDNEIKINELKEILGLPTDETINGYGLNFVGRNVARSRYTQKTEKELRLNTELSKNIDTTQNLVLKGDNLDTLKILKSHYTGKIKCIYIDPPYNTASDEFVYPDKFNREEAEVLGLVDLSQEDYDRMEFSFKSKKSHNGWLTFMYPRLMLARDLLSQDGVIFISIDDNEQANLKLLCDEIFGEENFVVGLSTIMNLKGNQDQFGFAGTHEYTLIYAKSKISLKLNGLLVDKEKIQSDWVKDEFGYYKQGAGLVSTGTNSPREHRPSLWYPIFIKDEKIIIPPKEDLNKFYNPNTKEFNDEFLYNYIKEKEKAGVGDAILPLVRGREASWRWGAEKIRKDTNDVIVLKTANGYSLYKKQRPEIGDIPTIKPKSLFYKPEYSSGNGTNELRNIFGIERVFSNPKPIALLYDFLQISTNPDDIILDFFAGSGTTGHAVMQLNAEDGGNRKFILCQIDEPIKKDKPAYAFCQENHLPTAISSITIDRLRRVGEKINTELKEGQSLPDIGYKVFDTIDSPKLEVEGEDILFPEISIDPLSRIYNMMFSVGLDEPSQVPECLLENCLYKIGDNYYITNADLLDEEENKHLLSEALQKGKVYIDGWTASINTTLQNYKEEVKIIL